MRPAERVDHGGQWRHGHASACGSRPCARGRARCRTRGGSSACRRRSARRRSSAVRCCSARRRTRAARRGRSGRTRRRRRRCRRSGPAARRRGAPGAPGSTAASSADRLVQRVRRDEVALRVGGVGADEVVVEVVGHLAGEHRLPGVLVTPAAATEALLVAVVHDRVAPREVHQLMGQPVAGHPLRVAGAGVVRLHEPSDAAHVVVAEEGRQLVDVGVGVGVPVVAGEERS